LTYDSATPLLASALVLYVALYDPTATGTQLDTHLFPDGEYLKCKTHLQLQDSGISPYFNFLHKMASILNSVTFSKLFQYVLEKNLQ